MAGIKQAVFKFQPFSRKQMKILSWWMPESPVHDYDGIIADGAIRSGKTLSMSLSFVMWAMESFENQAFAMCGKTIGSFRRNVLFWLKLMLKSRGYGVSEHRTENLVVITRMDKTNYFYIFGGKDERSQDLIQGITLAGCFFDEVALMPESFVNQATGRCSVAGSKFWFNCNPDGPYHWFKKSWIDKAEMLLSDDEKQKLAEKEEKAKKLLYLHFDMNDNLSLSEDVKERYRSMYTGVFYDRYIRGLWTVAEGIIYDMFDKSKHIVNDYKIKSSKKYISIDYGTQNATVFLLWGEGLNNQWICEDEYYYSGRTKGTQKTDSEYASDLENFVAEHKLRISDITVIVDPSAASFIAELKRRRFKIRKARNDVLDGIRFVAAQLNDCKILFSDRCKNTIKEFASYVWDNKAAEHGEDKPIKQNDHAMDAVRYFCYTVLDKRGGFFINIDF